MSCTYQSTTLQTGQSFVLPPGAILLSATDPGLLTSQNDCAADQIANLETPVCYKFRFSGANHDTGSSRSQNWEDAGNYYVEGILVNDVYYPFNFAIQGWQTALSYETAMNSITDFTGLFTNFGNTIGDDGGQGGWTNQVNFTTIPSIADNMQFRIRTTTQWQGVFSGTQTYAYVKGELCG